RAAQHVVLVGQVADELAEAAHFGRRFEAVVGIGHLLRGRGDEALDAVPAAAQGRRVAGVWSGGLSPTDRGAQQHHRGASGDSLHGVPFRSAFMRRSSRATAAAACVVGARSAPSTTSYAVARSLFKATKAARGLGAGGWELAERVLGAGDWGLAEFAEA